jgi:fumarate reductase flavoprotein subunit
MMGGVVFRRLQTELTGLFAAGEDTGGVHGANRLGGNGVANSTVFGGIAGDSMARWVQANNGFRAPDEQSIFAAIKEAERPFAKKGRDLESIRESLFDCMWKDVGIIRSKEGLVNARDSLSAMQEKLMDTGVVDGDRALNAQWHDWLNLRNLISVSRVITEAALARDNSRGAHFREDYPTAGDLESSTFTTVRLSGEKVEIVRQPVQFVIVKPGESVLQEEDAAVATPPPVPAT